jgi:hypothetical protein
MLSSRLMVGLDKRAITMALSFNPPIRWQLFERRLYTGESVDGQIQPAPLLGYEWHQDDQPPPVYEPQQDGTMFMIPSGLPPHVKVYVTSEQKPSIPPELLINCIQRADSPDS